MKRAACSLCGDPADLLLRLHPVTLTRTGAALLDELGPPPTGIEVFMCGACVRRAINGAEAVLFQMPLLGPGRSRGPS